MSSLPVPATSSLPSAINGRTTPADDAARFLKKVNDGDRDEAMKLFASLMGVDNPDEIPPISSTDNSSYESAFMTQVGAQMQMRQWAMTTLPRLLGDIKIKP
jgi:hypothetical protein